MSTPKLKSTTETVIRVEYYDLDSFIQQITNQDFECVAIEEWENDSEHRFIVSGKLTTMDLNSWGLFKTGKLSGGVMPVYCILNGLCLDGHIPAGTYLIRVSW